MDINQIKVVKRTVKYPRLELKTGRPLLILPQKGHFDPEKIIKKHESWLRKKLEYIEQIKRKYSNEKIYRRLKEELMTIIERWVRKYSQILGVKPEKITIRLMKTRWGSCSRKKRLSFNLLLKYLPSSLIKYVVFHEMAHLIVPNHRRNFWQLIKQEFNNPDHYEEALFGYWFLLLGKLGSLGKLESL